MKVTPFSFKERLFRVVSMVLVGQLLKIFNWQNAQVQRPTAQNKSIPWSFTSSKVPSVCSFVLLVSHPIDCPKKGTICGKWWSFVTFALTR